MTVLNLFFQTESPELLLPEDFLFSYKKGTPLTKQEIFFVKEYGDGLLEDSFDLTDDILILRNKVFEIVGMQSFNSFPDENLACLQSTIVHRDFRLQGIGTKLIYAALDSLVRSENFKEPPLVFLSPAVTRSGEMFRKALLAKI